MNFTYFCVMSRQLSIPLKCGSVSRKWGGVPTGITQNVKDLLSSSEIENILDNSDFICMLNQSAGDRDILQEKLHISDEQIKYVTNSGQGKGLIRYGKTILPFEDKFPKNTVM